MVVGATGGKRREHFARSCGWCRAFRYHSRQTARTSVGAQLVAMVEADPNRREAVSQQFNVPAFASHSDLMGRVDAAVVAAPTFLHYEIAKDLLQAGIDLLVEKPLTITASHARELAEIAKQKRRVLQVGHIERFNPAWTQTVSRLGAVKYVEAVRASSFPGRCLDVGVVLDLMIHDIDLVLSLTDAALVDVQATGMQVITDHEDLAEARLTFADGLVANLKSSRISPTAARRMQLYGSQGFAEIEFGKPTAQCIAPHASILNGQFQLAQAGPMKEFRESLFQQWLKLEEITAEPRNAILDELNDFVIAASHGTAPLVTGDAGARAVEVAERVLQTIATKNTISHRYRAA